MGLFSIDLVTKIGRLPFMFVKHDKVGQTIANNNYFPKYFARITNVTNGFGFIRDFMEIINNFGVFKRTSIIYPTFSVFGRPRIYLEWFVDLVLYLHFNEWLFAFIFK